jgi:hypothetical protein
LPVAGGLPIVIVDPSIVNMRGHMRRLAWLLASYFLSERLDVTILTHSRYGGPDFAGCRTGRVFDRSPYQDKAPDEASAGFVSDLTNWMSREGMADAVFLYPTVTPGLAEEIAQAIAASSPRSVHVPVLMLDVGLAGPMERPTVVDEATVERYRASLAAIAAAANKRVIVAVPSRTLAAYVRSICPLPVTEVAPPLSIAPAAEDDATKRGRGEYQLGLYLGAAATDKGFGHLPAVIQMIGEASGPEWTNVRVHVQAFGAGSYTSGIADVVSAVKAAPFASRFSLRRSRLEDAEYDALFRSLDAGVLAYDPRRYAGKTSGVFWELKSLGTPLAMPEDTWMSREAPLFPGINVPIAGYSAAATFAATRRLVIDRPHPMRERLPSGGAAEMARQILAAVGGLG